MNRNIFVIALAMTFAGLFMIALYQRRYEAENSGGDKVKLLSAAKSIERGAVLADDMLVTKEVPLAYAEDRAIKEGERARIIGLRVNHLMQEEQTLLWTDLVSTEEQHSLSDSIQPGSRAVTIRTERENSNAPLIKPGDYVDVISVIPDSPSGLTDTKTSVILLQRVLVLASGLNTTAEDPNGNVRADSADSTLLTLSVTLTEAQVLALATEHGHLSVVIRPPADQRVATAPPDISSKQLYERAARTNVGADAGAASPNRPRR